jgi:hypothetical protein
MIAAHEVDPMIWRTFSQQFVMVQKMSTLLFAESGPRVRPEGVRALGLACFVVAAYVAVNGLLVVLGLVSFASGAYVLGGLEVMGPLIYFMVAASLAVLGWGLLRGWRWSRRGAVIAAGLLIAGAVMPVSAAVAYSHIFGIVVHGAKIVLAIVIIRYLLQPEVVEWFAR